MESPVFSAGLELRAAGDGSRRLSGRFPYNKRAVLDAGGKGRRPKKEQFAPKAFSFAVEDPDRDIHLLSGHTFDKPLASKKAKTLILTDSADALTFEAILTQEIQQASWVRDFLAAFAAGLVGGISPGFRVAPPEVVAKPEETTEEDLREGDALIRTIFAAILFELSLVTRPAYHETDVSLRSWQTHQDRLPVRGLIHPMNRWRA
ncbi:HK97 family phage prohead protease [Pseudogemmobacter faecipullorum]|uniref:HK97 family phage prohead protease n=1 Tax=Pseudogemmobacter faecipullorum TaxID=2755041 RepID=A0ABS8CJV0_9RHOB|nr:HK97 family phage prohead protease [Pseudogemmobacter faecipullorum]MCB5409453.1 HK97 family phage prohead protease [Pseudogemmobacter faecipullorum]